MGHENLKPHQRGKCQELLDIILDFIEQAMAETKDGSLTWLMGALGIPDYPGDVHSYGSVIGTGNAVVEWNPAWKEGGVDEPSCRFNFTGFAPSTSST